MNDQQNQNEAACGGSALTAVLAACPSEGSFSEQQIELYELMSEISEDCYCAGWMMGLEYAIWGALQDGDLRYGMGEMDAASLMRCRALSLTLGGWIVWVDDDTDPSLTHEHWGPRFVPMDVWLQMVEAANA